MSRQVHVTGMSTVFQPLPELNVVQTRLPGECFGDAVMVLEFINCFTSLFDLREYFPKGFTYGTYIVIILNPLRPFEVALLRVKLL